jgi:hypothetical protein
VPMEKKKMKKKKIKAIYMMTYIIETQGVV